MVRRRRRHGAPRPDAAAGADAGAGACDPTAAIAVCRACHGPQRAEAGLDLSPLGLADRLVGVESARCAGRLLIDPAEPERSLMLALVDPARYDAAGQPCGLGLMPPGSAGLAAEDVACLASWVDDVAGSVEPPPPPDDTPIDGALVKVKSLLTGGAPTAEERAAVVADPAALRALLTDWIETPAFEAKLQTFLQTALQQDFVGALEDQLDKPRGLRARLRRLEANLAESFARTAVRIVRDRRPFTDILTTRDWELTTAATMALVYADQNANQRGQAHTLVRRAPADAPRPVTVEWMVENRTWVEPSIPQDCDFIGNLQSDQTLDFLLGLIRCRGNQPDYRYENPALLDADFTDWRTITLSNANADNPPPVFYDLPTLRAATGVRLRVRRAGFFTTPAFLANFPTNDDNLFRVTTNQALIVALQTTFASGDPTEAFESDAVDDEHADPATECYGCHRLLDPMRVAMWDAFSPKYQRAQARTDFTAQFAFQGHRVEAPMQTPIAFGQALASHPRFKTAWVQRLCYWANSQACNEADPAFVAIADAFEASGYDLKALLVDLFASPLVLDVPLISVTRANHFCPLVEERMGDATLCNGLGDALGLIPKDEFSRGDTVPAMASLPSTFGFAAAEALCQRLAGKLVGGANTGRPLNTAEPEAAVRQVVERLMGLHTGHPRHDAALAALQAHYEAARALPEATNGSALREVAAVACLSPDVMGVGL
ncbi:MAG: hypothetical protein H6706_20965 [Myxococcales bacterium]|nr:hypothetical protein [Myxococcales bacterium]